MLFRRSPGFLLILLVLFAPVLPCASAFWEDSSPEIEAVAVARSLPARHDAGRPGPRETPETFRTSLIPLPPQRPSARVLTGRLNQ